MKGRKRYRAITNHRQERTGSAAAILGMSEQGVAMYEKYGLVYPDRHEANGYRSFDLMDIVMLQNARVLRESGFTLKDVQRLTHGTTCEEVAVAYGDLLASQRQNLRLLELKIAFLEQMCRDIKAIPRDLYRCELAERPAMYRFEYMESGGIDLGDEQRATIGAWSSYAPFTMISTRYPRGPIEDGTLCPTEYRAGVRAGLGIYARYAERLGVRSGGCVELLDPAPSVHCVTHANNDGLNPDFAPVLSFMDQNHLRIAGDAVSFGIVGLNFDREFDRYCHLWVPYECDSGVGK